MEIAFVLALLVLAIVLFSTEVLSVDVVTLLLLVALVVGGVLTPAQAFAGFSSELIVTLLAIFVLSGALRQTGAVAALAQRLQRLAAGRERRLLGLLLGAVGATSAVMNNTTATAVFMPPALQAAERLRVPPSRLLMPIAFASILGGTCTLVGTSTNLAVSGYLAAAGDPPLGLFELTPVGLTVLPLGILYLLTVGRRLIPSHAEESLVESYDIRHYLSEVELPAGSPLAGQHVFDSTLSRLGLRVLEIHRDGRVLGPGPEDVLESGDLLLVQGPAELLAGLRGAGLRTRADRLIGDAELAAGDLRIAEAIVAPGSDLVGRSVRDLRFRQRFGAVVLAVHRGDQTLRGILGHVVLHPGDMVLLQGPGERVEALRRNRNLWVIEQSEVAPAPRPRRGWATVAALVAAVLVGGFGWLPLSVAFLSAALVAVLLRAITVEEAYRLIEWKLIVLIAGMTAFGTAMESSGAAAYLAGGVVALFHDSGPLAVLAGFTLLTIFLTQPMSNAAAALVVLPVALSTAVEMGVSDRPFAIAIALAASLSFITPLEPSCLLVYGPGRYRFRDFAIVGGPLTLLLLVVVLLMVPWLWPF